MLELVLPWHLIGLTAAGPLRLLRLAVQLLLPVVAGPPRLVRRLPVPTLSALATRVMGLLLMPLAGAHLLAVLAPARLARSAPVCLLLSLLALLTALMLSLLVLSVLPLLVLCVLTLLILARLTVLLSLSLLSVVRLPVVLVRAGVLVVVHNEFRVRDPYGLWDSSPQIGRTPFSPGRSPSD